MKNVINITKCDNELTIVAVSSDRLRSYQIARVGSGPGVDITLVLEKGTFVEPKPFMNSTGNTPPPSSAIVSLPADTYSIYYTGLNFGGPYNFEFTLNEATYKLLDGSAAAAYGYVWNHGGPKPSDILVTIG
ncbi:MAG: hypothetical protein ACJASQ_000041 [Crocinitomicaceae bacterium]|jgi:hypothetical protein